VKKILLINPRIEKQGYIKKGDTPNLSPHIGLLCLGAYLEKKYPVKILDCRLIEDHIDAIKAEIKKGDIVCVGISVMTAQIEDALVLSEVVKSVDKNMPIVWGGIHCTLFPESTCKDPLVDYVVVKEGEKTFLELVTLLDKTNNKPTPKQLSSVKGLVFKTKSSDKVTINPDREFLEPKEIPMPAYNLIDAEQYLGAEYWFFENKVFRSLPIHAGRGCYYRCAFCINTLLNKRRWRGKSAEQVLKEIKYVVKKYKVNLILIMDEDFFANKARVEKIADGLIKMNLGVQWAANVRANYFHSNYINSRFMAKLRKSGCISVGMGVESGSERVRSFLKKDITIDGVYNCAKLCNRYKIIPDFSFIIGLPTETKAELKETLKLVYMLKQMCPTAIFAGLQPFRPYPGGELWEFCKTYGFKEPQTLRGWVEDVKKSDYADVNKFPWVQNPEFVNDINYYLMIFQANPKRIRDKLGSISVIIAKIINLRWKFQFWGLLYEYKLFKLVSKLFGKRNIGL